MLKIKIIILGDMYCGKSSILNRYINNKFISENIATIGVDFYNTTIKTEDDKEYKLFIWDTSGQEKFYSIVSSYYRNIAVAILVFDLSNLKSFKNIKKWIDNIYHHCNKNVIIKLVGNKCDKSNIEVLDSDIKHLCNNYKLDYFKTSAKNYININEIFNNIIEDIDNKIINGILKPNESLGLNIIEKFKIEDPNNIKTNKCCIIL